MPRRTVFTVNVDLPVDVVYRHFTTIGYWQDLIAHYEETSTRTELRHFSSDESGTDISFAHLLRPQDLPAIARPVVTKTIEVTRSQHFEPLDTARNEAIGHYSATAPAPVQITGNYALFAAERGSQMRLETTFTARVPIIGGQIEGLLATGLGNIFANEGQFTTDWVADNR